MSFLKVCSYNNLPLIPKFYIIQEYTVDLDLALKE